MHPSLWVRQAAPLRAESSPLPTQTEVVVIGAGIAGVSTALALTRKQVEVVVLEAGDVACRASGRNDGQLLLGLGEHYNRIVGQFGPERARDLWNFILENNQRLKADIAAYGIDCDLELHGGLRLAETEHELRELAEAAQLLDAEGIEHRLHDAATCQTMLPLSRGFHGGLFLPGEAVVQPAKLIRGLANEFRNIGGKLFEGQRVLSLCSENGEHRVVLEGGAEIHTSVIVHCTSVLARELDPSGFLSARVFPFRGQIIASDPLPTDLQKKFPAYAMSSNFCYEYFRLHGSRFVLGGMRWSVAGEEQGALDDSTYNPTIEANLKSYVSKHFPALADIPFPHSWTGIMAGTGDGLPLLGTLPGQVGAFALLGFNGYGLSFAYFAGEMLAQQIIDGKAEHPAAAMFAPRRFL